ncbi:mechanosensitive ion channel family protein [Ramlibacter agri]|uniref:mechanosensitive ion channel family protein n=1 Tax=Ramlibacter agri TaxID=2728837 RepID=UPI00315B1E9F
MRAGRFALLLVLLAALSGLACGQVPAAVAAVAATPASAPPQDEATVRIYSRKIATFRAPFLGIQPPGRASRAQEAIEDLLEAGGPGVVTVRKEPQGNVVLVDGAFALILTPEDVDPLRPDKLDATTQATVAALSRAINETHEARDQGRLLRAVGFSLIATALFAFLAWAVVRLRGALSARIGDLLAQAAQRARGAGQPLWEATRPHAIGQWLVRAASWVLLVALAYEWLVFVLQQFPATRVWGEQLGLLVLRLLEQLGGNMLRALPDLLVAAIIFLLARALVAAVRPIFDRAEKGQSGPTWLDHDLAAPTRRLVSVGIWIFAVVMAYPYLPGSQSEAFKGMSVLIGLMITLGGSSLIGQAFSGVILLYGRVLRVGEYIRVGGNEGTVLSLALFTTRIRTGMGEEVTLPNSVILANVTVNYSRTVQGAGFIVDTSVTIGYDTPWRQVHAILLEAAGRTEGICAEPAARVFQTALSDFYVEYRLVCQATPQRPLARAELMHLLNANVLDVFNEHGVQIMSPHYFSDPAGAKVVPPGDPYAAPSRRPPASSASAESVPTHAAAAARPPTSP